MDKELTVGDLVFSLAVALFVVVSVFGIIVCISPEAALALITRKV